jgi:hypothetical protein
MALIALLAATPAMAKDDDVWACQSTIAGGATITTVYCVSGKLLIDKTAAKVLGEEESSHVIWADTLDALIAIDQKIEKVTAPTDGLHPRTDADVHVIIINKVHGDFRNTYITTPDRANAGLPERGYCVSAN